MQTQGTPMCNQREQEAEAEAEAETETETETETEARNRSKNIIMGRIDNQVLSLLDQREFDPVLGPWSFVLLLICRICMYFPQHNTT